MGSTNVHFGYVVVVVKGNGNKYVGASEAVSYLSDTKQINILL